MGHDITSQKAAVFNCSFVYIVSNVSSPLETNDAPFLPKDCPAPTTILISLLRNNRPNP